MATVETTFLGIKINPIYRQLLSSCNPSDPYDNRELRDNDAETSLF